MGPGQQVVMWPQVGINGSVEGRTSVCGSEHKARIKGPGFRMEPALEAVRKLGRSQRRQAGLGVTYSYGRGEEGMEGLGTQEWFCPSSWLW